MFPNANYHTHTTLCDGSNTPEEVAEEAKLKGFLHLGFSGHMDPGVSMDFPVYDKAIRALQDQYRDRMEILRGVEADNIIDPACAPGVEYRIGSTHFIPAPGSTLWDHTVSIGEVEENGRRGSELIGVDGSVQALHEACLLFYHDDFYQLSSDYYRFESTVAGRLRPAFIGHFDLVTRFNDLPAEQGGHFLDETSEAYLKPAFAAMEAIACSPEGRDLPFEVNLGALNRGRKAQPYPRRELLRHLRELDVEILLSSDAHQKEKLDGAFAEGLAFACACGYDHVNILTREATERPARNTRADGQGITGGPLYWKRIPIRE